ncbi:MAG: DnaJ domain-containing protein [Desulfamplus sp.]|nr:DnaJ domain-containing protein [Desulfamplus sp.]MBF0257550.1 DnaJ domain-containing protein [Desulfamplus sp.]
MSTYHKILLGLIAAAYLISPIDIIPDFLIPYLGWFDDTFIIGTIFYYIKNGRLPDYFLKKAKANFRNKTRDFKDTAQKSTQSSTESQKSAFSKNSTHSTQKNRHEPREKGDSSSSSNNSSGSGGQQTASGKERNKASSHSSTQKKDLPKSPHQILGVAPGASREDIIAAYRRGVKQYHPDRVAHLGKELQELAGKKFIEIKEAYNKLINI